MGTTGPLSKLNSSSKADPITQSREEKKAMKHSGIKYGISRSCRLHGQCHKGLQPSAELGGVGPGYLPKQYRPCFKLCLLQFFSLFALVLCIILCKAIVKWNLNALEMFSTYAVKKQVISLITMDIINSLSCCCKPQTFARCSIFCPHVFTVFEARIG